MYKFTFKDGANGFGLDSIYYNNGYAFIKMLRFEDKVNVFIKQTSDGLKVYEYK